jgi:hypothetical protein
MSRFHDASNRRAGKKIINTRSGVIDTGGKALNSPIINPASTNATAYGTLIHLMHTAVAEATSKRARNVSSGKWLSGNLGPQSECFTEFLITYGQNAFGRLIKESSTELRKINPTRASLELIMPFEIRQC